MKMNEPERTLPPPERSRGELASCRPEDFDGHNEFSRLEPAQKLKWLCEAATYVFEFKGRATEQVKALKDSKIRNAIG